MSNLFKTLEYEAFRAGVTPRTKQSQAWFRRKLGALKSTNIDRRVLINKDPLIKENAGIVGSMYMYFYDPKTKATLPYYDKFPLTIIVGPAPGGFYGLNLHYLPLPLRAKFLDELLNITNNKAYNESTKFKLSYDMLKRSSSMKYFKPCFKHYLNKHVKSHFAKVLAPEYEIAVFLPTASWVGASSSKIYTDSRSKI